MSNNIIGDIYRQVIDKVIRAAENDFEEGGYPRETLDELKAGWEQNLSKLHVAHMPWDPPPHSAVPPQQQQQQHQHHQQQSLVQNHDIKDAAIAAINGPTIKNEPQYEPQIKAEPKFEPDVPNYPALNGYQGNAINPMAGHRAAANILQQFGPQGNASIRAAGLPQQPKQLNHTAGQQQQQQQRPPQQQNQRPQNQGQYGQNAQNTLPSAQNDGAVDDLYSGMSMKDRWESLVIATRNVTDEERETADQVMRQNLSSPQNQTTPHLIKNAMLESLAEEDANILLPNNERTKVTIPKSSRQISTYSSQTSRDKGKQRLQVDGGEDSDDAINSDLDDSEEELDGVPADDDGPLGEMILCTWDKVNRVKNKWRCTLKDGILTTGGKEYLFHKATGEFEW